MAILFLCSTLHSVREASIVSKILFENILIFLKTQTARFSLTHPKNSHHLKVITQSHSADYYSHSDLPVPMLCQ